MAWNDWTETEESSPAMKLTIAAGAALLGGLAIRGLVRQSRHMDLRGRTVLITGGSRGLGLILAREAIDRGARVAICSRDADELESARRELESRGGQVLAVQCDVTVNAQVEGMVQGVLRHFGSIDLLINNAGAITVGPFENLALQDFEHAMKIHFAAPLYTIIATLPSMRRRGQGRIVNIASIGGKVPVPHLVSYCTSKFALVGLSASLRGELAREGIYVTTVSPGLMRTGSPRNVDVVGQQEKEYALFVTSDVTPMLSMNPVRTARRILDAACHGQAELIMPMNAKIAAKFYGLFPGLHSELSQLINQLLPKPSYHGPRVLKGYQSDSLLVPDSARTRNNKAAMANNELPQETLQ